MKQRFSSLDVKVHFLSPAIATNPGACTDHSMLVLLGHGP